MNEIEQVILVKILESEREIKDKNYLKAIQWRTPEYGRRAWNQRMLAKLGVPFDTAAWFGRPLDVVERKRVSRCVERLERLGYLVRANWLGPSIRATHVRLTKSGRQKAEELAEAIR